MDRVCPSKGPWSQEGGRTCECKKSGAKREGKERVAVGHCSTPPYEISFREIPVLLASPVPDFLTALGSFPNGRFSVLSLHVKSVSSFQVTKSKLYFKDGFSINLCTPIYRYSMTLRVCQYFECYVTSRHEAFRKMDRLINDR